MSSEDEGPTKRRRAQRACDMCRRRKIRCKETQTDDSRCLHCATFSLECSYQDDATNTQYAPPKSYLIYIENRLKKAEALLHRLHPDIDFSHELGPRFDRSSWPRDAASATSEPSHRSVGHMPTTMPVPTGTAVLAHAALHRGTRGTPCVSDEDGDGDSSDEDEITGGRGLEAHLRSMHLHPMHTRYLGKSSEVKLLLSALSVKSGLAGRAPDTGDQLISVLHHGVPRRRPEYWQVYEWEKEYVSIPSREPTVEASSPFSTVGLPSEQTRINVPAIIDAPARLTFPPDDLLFKLVDAYFTHVNMLIPLLHRPSLERSMVSGTHLNDTGFGEVLLLVCTVGARYMDDERVLLDGVSKHSAGWEWFRQVHTMQRSVFAVPCLYDLQLCCLRVMCLHGSTALWQASWNILGGGLRLAQDVGAHRRKVYSGKPTVHDELWRRAFWVLVSFDRHLSSVLGRPCAIQDEDFDVDLPIDCDDEYWENDDPNLAFKQPPGKPSKVAFFISLIKQQEILASALRTIYSINKSKVLIGLVRQEWEQRVVSDLDSALNQWVDSVPDHLRWDPNRKDVNFFTQSAHLYAAYYMLQITVHRPFIPTRRDSESANPRAAAGFPSLAICTNAARGCAKVVHTLISRVQYAHPEWMPSAFISGVVLLLSIWSGRRAGSMVDPTREMADVYKCMDVLRVAEQRWQFAGRMWDMLAHLASVSNVPLPENVRGAAQKRTRELVQAVGIDTNTSLTPTEAQGLRAVIDNRRAHAYPGAPVGPASISTAGAPSFAPPHDAQPGTSQHMSAPYTPSGSVPPIGWVQAATPLPPHGSHLGDHVINNSIPHVRDGVDAFVPASGETNGHLGWWAYANSAVATAASYPPGPMGTSGADLDAIGAALDTLLSRPGHAGAGLPGNDPLAIWTRTPLSFETAEWSQDLFGMGGDPPQPHY